MKIYKTQKEIEVDIKNDVLVVDVDVKFEVSFSISASLKIAWNINAWNINAWDINAWNINARDILYYAFCEVYNSIKCLSIKAKREKHNEPICLDGKLEIKDKTEILELTLEDVAEKFGKDVKDIKIKK